VLQLLQVACSHRRYQRQQGCLLHWLLLLQQSTASPSVKPLHQHPLRLLALELLLLQQPMLLLLGCDALRSSPRSLSLRAPAARRSRSANITPFLHCRAAKGLDSGLHKLQQSLLFHDICLVMKQPIQGVQHKLLIIIIIIINTKPTQWQQRQRRRLQRQQLRDCGSSSGSTCCGGCRRVWRAGYGACCRHAASMCCYCWRRLGGGACCVCCSCC
jgi:hypothetical protein